MTDEQLAWLQSAWHHSKPIIQAAVDRADGCFDIEHVWSEIDGGRAQLWPCEKSAIVTRIEIHPSGMKTLLGWLAGGEMEEVKALAARAENWARSKGCTRIEIIGRRGWLRAFEGYREACTVLVKDL
jgi:GNAT superfamily N-acetyltransferase